MINMFKKLFWLLCWEETKQTVTGKEQLVISRFGYHLAEDASGLPLSISNGGECKVSASVYVF
jgi:hypothetical protein